MTTDTRKPKMNEHRRKVLNLLEYILEVDSSLATVYDAFFHVSPANEDLNWVEDKEWAQWFEEYANKLGKGEDHEVLS